MYLKANLPRPLPFHLWRFHQDHHHVIWEHVPVFLELSTQDALFGNPNMLVTVFEESKAPARPSSNRGGFYPIVMDGWVRNGENHVGQVVMHQVRLGNLLDLDTEEAFDARAAERDADMDDALSTIWAMAGWGRFE